MAAMTGWQRSWTAWSCKASTRRWHRRRLAGGWLSAEPQREGAPVARLGLVVALPQIVADPLSGPVSPYQHRLVAGDDLNLDAPIALVGTAQEFRQGPDGERECAVVAAPN